MVILLLGGLVGLLGTARVDGLAEIVGHLVGSVVDVLSVHLAPDDVGVYLGAFHDGVHEVLGHLEVAVIVVILLLAPLETTAIGLGGSISGVIVLALLVIGPA